MVLLASMRAQVEREYFARTPPYPVYSNPETARYNLKLGKLTARLSGNIQAEFNDNINLSDQDPQADLSIGPYVGVGFIYPISRNHVLQMDVGVGYRWYLNNPDASSLNVAPNTHFDYTIFIGDVHVTLHDRFSIQVDPVSRPELSAGSGKVTAFRRLINSVGLAAEWQATKDLGFFGGYDFTIDRSLTDEFKGIDRDEHSFYTGFNYALSPRVRVGMMGSYSFFYYVEAGQNNGSSYGIGPTLTWKLSRYLTASASVSYSVSSFDQTVRISQDSSFEGASYSIAIQHVLNQRTSHNLRFGSSVGLGLGSNFSETMVLQYGLNTMISKGVSLNGILAYENYSSSLTAARGGEEAVRYLFYLGSGYQFTKQWSVGVSYSFSVKDSALPGRDYVQNRLTLDLTRRF